MSKMIEFVNFIEKDSSNIIQKWINRPYVDSILSTYHMCHETFETHFAPKIISCCNNHLKGKGGEENYPIMNVLMIFFHSKVRYTDIEQLYNALRREYNRVIVEQSHFNELFDEINDAFDENISRIFKEIASYNDSLDSKGFLNIDTHIQKLKATSDVISQTEFEASQDMLDDLEEYEGMLLDSIEHNSTLSEDLVSKIILVFEQYGKILAEETTFLTLSDAFFKLSYSIQNSNISDIDTINVKMIEEYISTLCDELYKWRNQLKNGIIIEDNKSLISNLAFLENMFLPQTESTTADDALEWF